MSNPVRQGTVEHARDTIYDSSQSAVSWFIIIIITPYRFVWACDS